MAINGTDYDEYYQKAVYMTDEEMAEEDEREKMEEEEREEMEEEDG